ncbi:small vasohibin-binding protein isoform X1 [Peromyscus californicus insignis]|uniref:small vasohibin-binding protein isoform X1 n=1 Tax=Peromyscus californicus insignis TaxID=564181 RepID=UPI0022A7EBB4|nr:small vasohibin-binding protein isoform X1 [Peromyscus californicus insignis]
MTAVPLCRKLRLRSKEETGLGTHSEVRADQEAFRSQAMDPPGRKEKSKVKEPAFRVEKAKQKSAQQELKQRQRAEDISGKRGHQGPEWWRGSQESHAKSTLSTES